MPECTVLNDRAIDIDAATVRKFIQFLLFWAVLKFSIYPLNHQIMGSLLAADSVWKRVLHCYIDFAMVREIIQEENRWPP